MTKVLVASVMHTGTIYTNRLLAECFGKENFFHYHFAGTGPISSFRAICDWAGKIVIPMRDPLLSLISACYRSRTTLPVLEGWVLLNRFFRERKSAPVIFRIDCEPEDREREAFRLADYIGMERSVRLMEWIRDWPIFNSVKSDRMRCDTFAKFQPASRDLYELYEQDRPALREYFASDIRILNAVDFPPLCRSFGYAWPWED